MNNIENEIIKKLLENLFLISPEFGENFRDRYKILKVVNEIGPIGRRGLSGKTELSERIVRKESDIMKSNKLLETTIQGMVLTEPGKKLLNYLDEVSFIVNGLREDEVKIAKALGIKKVIISPIDSHNNDEQGILNALGNCTSKYLKQNIQNFSIIGLSGGTTIAKMVEKFEVGGIKTTDLTIVPARGNLGNKVEYQANTLVEKLASKLNVSYKLLFTPDNMSSETINELKNEPNIKETLNFIKKIDTLVFGVGKVDTMVKRRDLVEEEKKAIYAKKAVAEAFGCYFNSKGEIVYEINTIGIDLYKLREIKNLIAVAGGIDKIDSILSICKLDSNLVLVTDEEVAKEILRIFKEE